MKPARLSPVRTASGPLRSLTAYHVAELGLTGLEDALVRNDDGSTAVSEVLDNALRLLRGSEAPALGLA